MTSIGWTAISAASAALDGFRTTLAADLSVTPSEQALVDIDFQAAGTRITGGLTRTLLTGLINGGLSVVSPDVSVPAALALLEAEGAVNAEVTLAPGRGQAERHVCAAMSAGLRVNDIRVGAADINATIGDLFGVPVIDGSVNASDVAAAGVDIETLTATRDAERDDDGVRRAGRAGDRDGCRRCRVADAGG